MYSVKEIFRTVQGEGANAGRVAVFVRFSGCNAWTGRQEDRGQGASCSAWCDTEFRGTDGPHGGQYGPFWLVRKVSELWGPERPNRFVVLTGGEPLLQADSLLFDVLKRWGFRVAVETNGSRELRPGLADWVTVSPKAGLDLKLRCGDELKLVWPQEGVDPDEYGGLDFTHFYLQPRSDVPGAAARCVEYCFSHPGWRVSVQAHKVLGLP